MLQAIVLGLAFILLLPAAAGATGLVRVQQSDGSVQEYPGARIDYSKNAKPLTITTANGAGTLTIDQAACSYIGELYRCLLTHMSVNNRGVVASTRILEQTGTIYANTTGTKLDLPRSRLQGGTAVRYRDGDQD